MEVWLGKRGSETRQLVALRTEEGEAGREDGPQGSGKTSRHFARASRKNAARPGHLWLTQCKRQASRLYC